ncbi:MAG: AAA family ATPase [Trueperaceae bacterium]|nr:AAA family ATPase [Trueperaceae bacterium]
MADLAREVEAAPDEATTELARRIRTDPGTTDVPPDGAVSPGAAGRMRLPGTTTKLVGREREIDEIAGILGDADCRLLSVVGPGGIGKTRVAIELHHATRPAFRDGATFVPMTAVADGDGMLSALAEALGLTFLGPLSMEEQLHERLRPMRMLLVVDNLEHLLGTRTSWPGCWRRHRR